jgi:hypothetical protein
MSAALYKETMDADAYTASSSSNVREAVAVQPLLSDTVAV